MASKPFLALVVACLFLGYGVGHIIQASVVTLGLPATLTLITAASSIAATIFYFRLPR